MWAKLIISSRWRRPSMLDHLRFGEALKENEEWIFGWHMKSNCNIGQYFLIFDDNHRSSVKVDCYMLFDFNTHDIVRNLSFLWGYEYRHLRINRQGQRIPPMTFATAGTVRVQAQTKRCTWWLLRYPGNPCDRGQDNSPLLELGNYAISRHSWMLADGRLHDREGEAESKASDRRLGCPCP